MTVVWRNQYRPPTFYETYADYGLNVSAIRNLADGMNNYVAHVARPVLIKQICAPEWYSFDGVDTENVIAVFALRHIPEIFNLAHWKIGAKRTAVGAGTDVTWRLYSNRWLYQGQAVLDKTKLSPDYEVSEIVSDSATHEVIDNEADPLTIVTGPDFSTFLVLTAQNETATERGLITTLDCWGYFDY